MKFESKMAQEAYDEIMKLGHNLNSSFDNEFQLSYTTRAIEVAAKIEIEEKRLEFEMNLKNPPMETIMSFPPGPRGGQDNDD